MTYTCFDVQITDGIAHIILNRPEKRNAMIAEFWTELPEIIHDIDANAKARVIVLSSTGPVFCAGLDVGMFQTDIGGTEDKNHPQFGAKFYGTVQRLQAALSCLETCRIPVLAAIQGGCYGGGVDLTTACDMRYATEDSFITIFEINVGMTADVDQETMLAEVMKIAKEIASKPPLAIYGCKRIITYSRDHTTADTLDNIAVWNMSMLIPSEMMEAMMSAKQKRAGKFDDLPKIKMT